MSQSRPEEKPTPVAATPVKHSFMHNLVCDAAPGAIVAYSLFPFENLKKYVQRNGHYPTRGKESFVAYRGSTIFAANIVPTTAIQLTTDRFFKRLWLEQTESQKVMASLACGLTGAITATAMENYVIKMQILNKMRFAANAGAKPATLFQVIPQMFKHKPYGPLTGYVGVGSRDSIFTLNMLYITPTLVKMAEEKYGKDSYEVIAARVSAGLLGAALSHPGDTIATKMQEPLLDPSAKRKGFLETGVDLYKNEGGVRRFYRGYPSRALLFTLFANGIPYAQKATDKMLAKAQSLLQSSESSEVTAATPKRKS